MDTKLDIEDGSPGTLIENLFSAGDAELNNLGRALCHELRMDYYVYISKSFFVHPLPIPPFYKEGFRCKLVSMSLKPLNGFAYGHKNYHISFSKKRKKEWNN